MATFSPSLIRQLARHHGVVTHSWLLADGVTSGELDRWRRSGLMVRVHDGVYRVATTPTSFEGRCLAACLADPELVVGGPSAARIWGFKHTGGADRPITAFVAHGRRPVRRDVRLRRTNALDPAHVVTDALGVRYTSPPRTWFDRARDLDDFHFEALTEQVLDRFCSVPTLWSMGRALMSRGRPGSARVRRVMSQRAEWQKPADSTLEFDVLRALERRGVHLVRQHRLDLRDGSTIHLDGADPDLRWGIEVDHVTWHGGRLAAQADKQRDLSAALLGWEVHRISDQHWRDDRGGLLDSLVELYRLAGGRRAA